MCYYEDFVHNTWQKIVDFSYRTKAGTHRYYCIVSCKDTNISLEFHHRKKIKTAEICGKIFFELVDTLGSPPKRKMDELRALIHSECVYQFKVHGVEWKEEYLPENIY